MYYVFVSGNTEEASDREGQSVLRAKAHRGKRVLAVRVSGSGAAEGAKVSHEILDTRINILF